MLDYQGMICLAANQVWWTAEVEHVFEKIKQVRKINTFKYHVFAPMGRFKLELITFILHRPSVSNSRLFLSCRPFVVITTFSRGLVGVEVSSVSWLGQ